MGIFRGANRPPVHGVAPFIEPGLYRLRIRVCKEVLSRKNDELFIVEFDVLESDNPKFAPGTVLAWSANMRHGETALINCKAFAAAVLDCEDEEVTEAVLDRLVTREQPAAGIQLHAHAFNIQTATVPPHPFTKVRWDSAASEARIA